jgi:hypothetical protein
MVAMIRLMANKLHLNLNFIQERNGLVESGYSVIDIHLLAGQKLFNYSMAANTGEHEKFMAEAMAMVLPRTRPSRTI